MTIRNHTLGFPRVGLRRELKKRKRATGRATPPVKTCWQPDVNCVRATGINKSRRASTCCRWAISPGTTMF